MKTQKIFALLFSLLVLFTTACKKDDDAKPDKKAIISEKTWKPNEAYANGQTVPSSAQVYTWRLKLNTDGTYTLTSSGGSDSGVWEFNSDQSKLITDKSSADETTWDIQLLEKGKLNIKYQDGANSIELKMIHAN